MVKNNAVIQCWFLALFHPKKELEKSIVVVVSIYVNAEVKLQGSKVKHMRVYCKCDISNISAFTFVPLKSLTVHAAT